MAKNLLFSFHLAKICEYLKIALNVRGLLGEETSKKVREFFSRELFQESENYCELFKILWGFWARAFQNFSDRKSSKTFFFEIEKSEEKKNLCLHSLWKYPNKQIGGIIPVKKAVYWWNSAREFFYPIREKQGENRKKCSQDNFSTRLENQRNGQKNSSYGHFWFLPEKKQCYSQEFFGNPQT